MKKLIFVFGLMLSLVACNGGKTDVLQPMNDSIEVTDSDSTVITTLGVDTIELDSVK